MLLQILYLLILLCMEDYIILVWIVIIYMYERIYDVENYVIQKKNLRIKDFGEFISGINYLVKIIK